MRNSFLALIIVYLVISGCATGQKTQKSELSTAQNKEIALAEQRLGETYYRSGKYTLALRKLLKALELLPNDEYIHNSLGLVYLAKEKYVLAQNHFETALKLNPDFQVAKNHLGAALMRQKKYDLAIQCFKEISEDLLYVTPENPVTNMGWAYFEQKEYTLAKQQFLKALDIRPCFTIATHGLATVYMEMVQYDNAFKLLKKCIKRIPKSAILHADMAKLYELNREFDKAQEEWQTVLMLAPKNSPLALEAEDSILSE